MKILFLCKHNRFRSKVAETIFNKLSNDKAESAGLHLDELRPYVEKNVIEIMKEKGYEIGGVPRKFNKEMIKNFDLIVVVVDDVDLSGFKGKMIKWKIPDCNANDIVKIREIIDEIEEKVKKLISDLDKKV